MKPRKLDPSQEWALCETLFAQGARCGHLEAGSADYDGPDHIRGDNGERWAPFEAVSNIQNMAELHNGYRMALLAGYLHGFSLRKRGFTLSDEIRNAPLPDGLLDRARAAARRKS